LVIAEPGAPFALQEIQVEDAFRDDEVLVEMKATGVCHTDLNFQHETSVPDLFPAVLGHEGGGVVVKAGAKVTGVVPGDHVLVTYTCCGECKNCKAHNTSFCTWWTRDNFGVGRPDGSKAYADKDSGAAITSHFFGQSSMARHAIVNEKCIVKVSKDAPLDQLAPLCCGIMTGAGAMINEIQPQADSTVVVAGAGAVGLAALMALKLCPQHPSKVIVVDVVPARLELALKYGATHTVNPAKQSDLKAALLALTDGLGIDGAIDATGRPEVINALLQSCAKRGKVVTVGVGLLSAEVASNIWDTINSGRTYTGCCMGSCYPQEFIPMLIEAWKRGDFPFTDLIKTYAVNDVETAAKDVYSGTAVKAVLLW